MTNMNLNPLELAEQASRQSDRWAMFLFIFVIIALFLGLVRYLLKRDERKSAFINQALERSTGTQIELGKTIERNTLALNASNEVVAAATRELDRHKAICDDCREKV